MVQPDAITAIPAKGGRNHLMATLHRLATSPRGGTGKVDLATALGRLGVTARRPGQAVVVSDFMTEPDTWIQPLRRLGARHEVIAIEVLDPRELSLPDVGVLSVVDPGSGRTREIPTASKKLRARFEAAATEQRAAIADGIRAAGADHLVLRTDRDWLLDVVRFVVERRERVHARRAGWGAR
jgi:uncharacterized protein (DUF58 family)